ncbi:MAG: cobyric acid synthase [Lachnospiraceae bacterium]
MAKPIMILGTMSNVGKSLLVGGLCRIFKQDGYKVAPFKSQNMALNSFITKEGLEMGRAQVMQAEAAGIEPCVCMNPILLKPTSDTGSQVIINGEVSEVLSGAAYYQKKKTYIPIIMEAYHQLDEDYDIIVIEGAGSPAEINLREEDIVNMGMAKMANAPALLVGDIDRGGVFAQMVGTMELLEETEKTFIKGMVINKFRGDRAILEPGLRMLEDKTKIPVQGVIPYVHLDIDDEDSLSERLGKKNKIGLVEIAVIRFPRISNFTDCNVLEYLDEVSLYYVSSPTEFGNPDMVILPGTKNTMHDLSWLRKTGLERKILQHAKSGKTIFGICGGYQMLGEVLSDPYGVEEKGTMKGLGLLPITTTFELSKNRTRVRGRFQQVEGIFKQLSGVFMEGYEIHMGVSTRADSKEALVSLTDMMEDKATCNCKLDGASRGNVYGSYVHGIFDESQVANTMVNALLEAKGYHREQVKAFDLQTYKETQYNLLADIIRENVDMKEIYRILEEGMSECKKS